MDPPDCFEAAARAAPHQPSPGPSTKRACNMAPTEGDFLAIGREIQNRSNHRVGTDLSENARFSSFFGCSAGVALITWVTMTAHSLLPDGGQIVHMLWALYFMKVYPVGNVGSSQVGSDVGAVDPKTWRLYLWPFIRGIAGLEMHLVSTVRLKIIIICYSNCFSD